MKIHRVGVIGGDGIGPEVTAEAVKVLRRAQDGFSLEFLPYDLGAERYLRTGELMPDAVFEEIRGLDAVLLGALGDPRCPAGTLERGILMRLRLGLDLYVNVRPVKLLAERLCPLKGKGPADVDLLVCRENTEDAYVGGFRTEHAGSPGEVVVQEARYSWRGCERVVRHAFERARGRRRKLTLVDKSNAIRGQEIWRRAFEHVARDFPDVERDAVYVDAACMWLVKNPEAFDVIVTSNMFGDILTDLGAAIQGGMGLAAGANLPPGKVSVFEPVHGSAPKYAGRRQASPLAAILAGAMLLDHVGEPAAAARVEAAVRRVLADGMVPGADASCGMPTDRVGDLVAGAI
jgi:3-isopropylmalate dehydrogenase